MMAKRYQMMAKGHPWSPTSSTQQLMRRRYGRAGKCEQQFLISSCFTQQPGALLLWQSKHAPYYVYALLVTEFDTNMNGMSSPP